MPRGHADYSNPAYKIGAVNIDQNTIIAGLGGVVSVDARGRILFADKFDNGLTGWRISSTASGADPFVSPSHKAAYFGGTGVFLSPLANAQQSWMIKDLGAVLDGQYGLEVMLYMETTSPIVKITISSRDSDGMQYVAAIRTDPEDEKIYLNESGEDVTVYDYSGYDDPLLGWTSLKIVGDWNTKKFIRACVGQQQFDLSANDLVEGDTGIPGETRIQVLAQGVTGYVSDIGAGYVIFTVDEP